MLESLSAIIQNHGILAIASSFLIGVVTSLAPCSIAAIPLIIGFSANVNIGSDLVERKKFAKQFTLIFTFGVALSITALFILMTQFKYILNSSPILGYCLAAILSFYVGLSGLGIIRSYSFHKVAEKFVGFRLLGALFMGILIGIVSTPCASPAIASILIVAQNQSLTYSSMLVFAFAIGHCLILIISGLSINFVQLVSKNRSILLVSTLFQKITAFFLIAVGIFFLNRVYILGSL